MVLRVIDSPFVVDSDVFITSKNLYYAFDICPGFWRNLIRSYEQKKVYSVERVRGELLTGDREEDLVEWVREEVPRSFLSQLTQ